jgi:HK97 family phage major capsid protein
MGVQQAREQIELLEESRDRLFNNAVEKRGYMNGSEKELHAEMEQKIRELKFELPANEPLSRPGSHLAGNQRAISGGNTRLFKSFGEQLQAIARAGMPGGQVDQRLHDIRAAASGTNETVPSEGGFLLQQGFSGELLQRVFTDPASILSRVTRVQVGGNSNSVDFPMVDETSRATGSRLGGVQTYYTDEAGAVTPSKPKFRKLHLELKKLMGICYATDELVQDASLLEFVVRNGFQAEIQFAVQDAIINGTGASQPLGILNSGALVSVAKCTGQKSATFVLENAVAMWERMPGRNRSNAAWLINSGVESQLYTMSLSVGTGGAPVFLPGGSASPTPYMTLFGRPIIPIEQCAALGTVGDVILADLSEYILIDKGGVREDVSIHVQFLADELAYRFIYRYDGAPMAAAPVTSYKGSVSQSAFVALATRA